MKLIYQSVVFVFVIRKIKDRLRRSLRSGAQWYSQRTSVLEVAGSIPAPVIVELL